MRIKPVLFAITTFTLAIALPPGPAAYAAVGDLDGSFGTNGEVVTGFAGNADGNAVAVQSDGKIIVVGQAGGDFAIASYHGNGVLDTSFGSGGKVTTDFGASDQAYAVAIQSDGKIVVAGTSGSDFALARYHSNGFLDTSFGNSGIVTTNYSVSGPGDSGRALAIQSDGKIVVAGYSYDSTQFEEFALLRYNSSGFLDGSFGSGGIVITSIGDITEDRAYAVAVQSDGRIVVAGESFLNIALARYTSNGVLDTTFNSDGIVTTDFGSDDAGYAVAIQSDGKIVVGGGSYVNDQSTLNCSSSGGNFCQYWDFSLARYNSNGSLDTSFSGDGKVTTDLNLRGNDDFARAVAIQADGKIVAAGYSETSIHSFSGEDELFSTDNQFSLARYNSSGSLDTDFSTDGIVVTDIDGSSDERGNAVAIQSDGKIIVAGSHNQGTNFALARYIGSAGATFLDVPESYWSFSQIETIAELGITSGCDETHYCPTDPVDRAQMAVFVERGMRGGGYDPGPGVGNIFLDVPPGYWAGGWIELLSMDGITGGCDATHYCPSQLTTRAEMAVFLLRGKYGMDYAPPTPVGVFNDVAVTYWAAGWIEQLAAEGITSGCGNGNYCPADPVNRDQMAVFLVNTFQL